MKRKFKRVSKRTLSVILAILIVMSTMLIGTLSVNAAATDGKFDAGDTIYFDFSQNSTEVANTLTAEYATNEWNSSLPSNKIVPVVLKQSIDISTYTGRLYNINSGGWKNVNNNTEIVPSNGQNMVIVDANGDYTWGTYGDTPPTPPTPTTKFSVTGRFSANGKGIDWSLTDNSTFVFTPSGKDDNRYYYETDKTVKELSQKYGNHNAYQFFYIYNGETLYNAKNTNLQECHGYDNAVSLVTGGSNEDMRFGNENDTSSETVTLWIEADGTKPTKLWYSLSGDQEQDLTPGAITLSDDTAVNGSLSFKAEGNTSGTADIGKNVTITAKPFAGFTCSGITVSYTKPVTAPDAVPEKVTQNLTVTDNTATFAVPDVQPNKKNEKEISFAASFTLDKVSYLSTKDDGLWIDVAPTREDTTATLIKWNNYYGHDHNTNINPYTFYVPKNVDLSKAKIYNGYNETVTVNGTQITAKSFGTVNLSYSGESGTFTTSKANIKVMQGSTNAMFLYTTKKGNETPLNTKTYAGWDDIYSGASKKDEKTDGGSCVTMFNDDTTTPEFSSAMALESVKGRGNSSWEASARRFGKYAYNMKLVDKTTLFGMATHTKKSAGSKSWCLLANNADESMLRNALAYKLAADTGLYSSPEFSFVDIYDNGEYLGQYLVTEKVDVGESKLVYGQSIEDLNEKAGLVFNEDPTTGWIKKNASFTADGKTYSYEYRYTSETTGANSPDISKATYLLEFEIEDRYMDEACWFTTPQGQHVVIKNPEFATEAQVKYIAEKFIAMEAKVFADAENAELSKHIDLDSFARMYLVQELSANLDAASTSYYVTYDCSKGDNARFVASPVWDYDWAFGQYEKTDAKYDVNDKALDPKATGAWFAKNKKYDDSSINTARKYSIQSKLANNSSFQQVIKKVWDGTDTQEGFYAKVQKYYGDNSQLDAWYNKISASVNMNETRWGFIKDDNVKNWGSADNSDTHLGAVNWLESSFLSPRASWMNGEFEKYTAYTQIAAPTLTAYLADGKTELTDEVAVGDSIVLKADTTEIFVTYELYKDGKMVKSNDDGVFTISAENGTSEYTVKTLYGASNRMISNAVSVTASGESAKLTGVSLSTSSKAVAGTQITLNATPATEGTVTGIIYSYYMSKDNAASADDTAIKTDTYLASCTATVPDTADTYYYYVKATFGETTVTSPLVSVEVTEQQGTHNVTFKFKAPSTSPYTPTITLDGKSYTMELTDECLGSIYTGSLKIYWYSVDILVDSTKDNTIRITTRTTDLNAVYTDKFNGSEYYLAVDNLVNGTEVVDLTAQPEHIRNYYHTPLHMVHSDDISDGSLGFTYVKGNRYRMGSYLVNGIATFSIDSVTAIQKLAADSIDVSELQNSLFDCNLDGVVDINDATLMQKALAQ